MSNSMPVDNTQTTEQQQASTENILNVAGSVSSSAPQLPADAPLRTPTPPLPAPPRGLTLLDGLLALVVVLLAVLLASSPARNGDVWMHLAAGKLLVAGQY